MQPLVDKRKNYCKAEHHDTYNATGNDKSHSFVHAVFLLMSTDQSISLC